MKQILLNAFFQNCPGHQSIGMWKHPRDNSIQYKTLGYWARLAQTLERGLFDGIFLADVIGLYDVYSGDANAALASGVQVPCNDPLLVIPAMAMMTENLGFGVTCNLSYEAPYLLARRMSTLDHLTNGRLAWNIVTGYLDSGAKSIGKQELVEHDERYDIAEEYMGIVYKLWERSWEDGAMVTDRERELFIDPSQVHSIHHNGKYFLLDAIHMCEPSPQRTPVIFQAGASSRGRAFSAKHAECVFINAPSRKILRGQVEQLRAEVTQAGRDPSDIKIFALLTVVVGHTDEEAQNKYLEYRKYVDRTGALALMSGWTGIDFSQLNDDEEVKYVKNNALQTAVSRFTASDPNRVWTVGEVAEHLGLGGASPLIVGSVAHVADEMEAFVEETGVDGFNLAYTVEPESMKDFVNLVVPELQLRGIYKTKYESGTLREKLFGRGAQSKLAQKLSMPTEV